MPHERRIEQRRRFQRILLSKVGSQQQPTVFAQWSIGEEVTFDVLKSSLEERLGILVTPVKFFENVSELLIDLLFR